MVCQYFYPPLIKKRVTASTERQCYGNGQDTVCCIIQLKRLILWELLYKVIAKISFHLKATIIPFSNHKDEGTMQKGAQLASAVFG